MATRWAGGDIDKHRAALFLLLTLPGVAILYQGDEIGLEDGTVPKSRITDIARPPRDPERTPLPWTPTGEEWRSPWLPLTNTSRNIQDTRDLIVERTKFSDDTYETLESEQGVWAYRRGERTCVLNMTAGTKTYDGAKLAPWEGTIL